MESKLSDFGNRFNTKLPGPPDSKYGYRISPKRGDWGDSDEAHYILKPDTEFDRPWLGAPLKTNNGIAYVWPLGVEGFSLTSNATAGVHHYLGDNDVDVDVVFPDEYHVTLSGTFPGRTSKFQMQSLRAVILAPTDAPGKLLFLPRIHDNLASVAIISYSFNHDQNDASHAINYSMECIQVGKGTKVSKLAKAHGTANPQPGKANKKGKSQSRTSVKGGGSARTAHTLAAVVYGDSSPASVNQLIKNNQKVYDFLGIPLYKAPYTQLPPGTVLEY